LRKNQPPLLYGAKLNKIFSNCDNLSRKPQVWKINFSTKKCKKKVLFQKDMYFCNDAQMKQHQKCKDICV